MPRSFRPEGAAIHEAPDEATTASSRPTCESPGPDQRCHPLGATARPLQFRPPSGGRYDRDDGATREAGAIGGAG
jgi:hypothetical protein